MNKYLFFGNTYQNIIKPVFFKFDPEFTHNFIIKVGKLLGTNSVTKFLCSKALNFEDKRLEQNILGIDFKNPVGLAAGFDKNANLLSILPEVGFGYMEVGSVTLNAYKGNPYPRLFRLPKSQGLVVYYGLMNDGVKRIAEKIKKGKNTSIPMGVSVAKTNSVETADEEKGVEDYFECLKYLVDNNIGDYYTINISCPNSFGGEPFTTPEKLEKLLSKLSEIKVSKPIFIKMPINLSIKEFDELLKVIVRYHINGVIIGNLTKVRDERLIKDSIPEGVKGGISGKPTFNLSNELISYTFKNYEKELKIIGVGGIFSAEDAYEKIKRGASLVQLITGMIFQGPQLIGEINKGLVELIKKDGYGNIREAVGKSL